MTPMTSALPLEFPEALQAAGTAGAPFEPALPLADLPLGATVRFSRGDLDVLIAHSQAGLLATDDRCPHMSAPLSAGRLEGCQLHCPLHRGSFDVRSGEVEIVSATLSTDAGNTRLIPTGTPCRLEIRYRAHREIDDFVVGVAWHSADGTLAAGHNTELDGLVPQRLHGEGEIRCSYPALDLAPGDYFVDVAVHTKDGVAFDYWCDALRLRVTSRAEWPGVWAPAHRWEWDGEFFE